MIFDPIKARSISVRETLVRLRNTNFDATRPMGNVAVMQLGPVIRLWLVGLREETLEILPKLYSWIEQAIDKKENFGESQNFHHMNLHCAAAICSWLILGVDSRHHWGSAQILNSAISLGDNDYDRKGFSTKRIDEYMAYANLSARYEAGIGEYERFYHPPKIATGVLKPRDFGYASCARQCQPGFEDADLFSAGRKMLKNHLQEKWLGTGQFIRAAMWQKIVYQYGSEKSLSPLQTLLMAYENMPDVSEPSFLNRV